MARTLGALVASMTLGALVLDWVQPNSIATATPSIGLIAPVNSEPTWQSIHVMAQRAGSRQAPDSHWLVERDGRAVATEHWKSKRRLIPGGEIRVALAAPAQSNEITPRQWSAAQDLLAQLQQDNQIDRKLVVIDDTLELPRTAKPVR